MSASTFAAPRLAAVSGLASIPDSDVPITRSFEAAAAFLTGPSAIGAALIAVSTSVAASGLSVASSVFSPAVAPAFANQSNGVITARVRCLPDSVTG